MSGDRLDLTDPAVRRMAWNHQPTEAWSMAGQLISVWCPVCNQIWPCVTAMDLRAWEEGNR